MLAAVLPEVNPVNVETIKLAPQLDPTNVFPDEYTVAIAPVAGFDI
jgi:hypothetical protein